MDTKYRKELLKAILQGDTQTVNKLVKDRTLYFKDVDKYYINDLKTEISKEQFSTEFKPGFDTLFEFGEQLKQRKLLLDFGVSEKEVNEYFQKQPSNIETINEIINLKNRLK